MDVIQAISDRRSIRKFEEWPVGRDLIETVLDAAIKAPSGKNTQPWRFIVLQGAQRLNLVDLMEKRVTALKEAGWRTGSAESTARIMRQAPVLILVFDPDWTPGEVTDRVSRAMDLVAVQAIGAAIQNMLLAATSSGLGTLWIADVLFAEQEIAELVGLNGGLVAAVSLGYPAESPAPRPRKSREEVTEWRE